MTWTVSQDDNDTIHVRAIIDSDQGKELRDLIHALEKRLPKETTDVRPDADV